MGADEIGIILLLTVGLLIGGIALADDSTCQGEQHNASQIFQPYAGEMVSGAHITVNTSAANETRRKVYILLT